MNSKQDTKKTSLAEEGLANGQSTHSKPSSSKYHPFCASIRQWAERGWSELVPRCGGCLSPRLTIQLLGSFVLVSGVMVSSAEGSLLVREEQKYRRCLLHQKGLVGNRHLIQSPDMGDAQDLLDCYPNDINLVRASAGLGVMLLVMLILCTMMMFVAVATEHWSLSLPWAYGCGILIVQEVMLVAGCWTLLGLGDIVVYAIHIVLLAYSATSMFAILRMVRTGEFNEDDGEP